MTVTSIAIIRLKDGVQPEDPNTSAGTLLQGRVSEILTSPGAQRCYWGRAIESADLFYLLVDWNTLQDHVDFTTNRYGYLTKLNISGKTETDLSPLFNGAPTVYHVELTAFPPNAISKPMSPVAEIVTIYFPSNLSTESQHKIVSNTGKFRSVLADPGGCNASSGGWIMEEVEVPGQGNKGRAFVMIFGWDSIEAHTECVKTPRVQEHVHLIAELEGTTRWTVGLAAELFTRAAIEGASAQVEKRQLDLAQEIPEM
ncbi:hypothetical protein LTR84_000640 [Exophiala bonariae]|uniref:ABM domain-containing protein n=1 Tax=Exophiala bonariae TaxID=1690606 RepID=A0AAV9NR44_9EURO|nr:hypothetical protein LTR84_000640 [Exophiala bonariae]